MSFVVTSLGSLGDTNARSDYTCTIDRAPNANTLVLVSITETDAAGSAVQPSSVSGAGMVFSLITSSVTFNTIASGVDNVSIWRSMSPTPSGSLITAHFGATATGCAILVTEVSGVSTSGLSGINAVGQSSISSVDVAASLKLIGPSATSVGNAWFAIHSANSQEVATPGQNWTAVDSAGYLTPDTHLASAWTTLSTGTSVTFTASGADNRGGVIVELVLDTPVVIPPSVVTSGRQVRTQDRLPPVPLTITGELASYLRTVVRLLNAEAYISKFSAPNPNTSGFTGIPGNLAINVGSASTWTRLWILAGSTASIDTDGWQMVRMA